MLSIRDESVMHFPRRSDILPLEATQSVLAMG
jgi:hypothetical protein